MAAPRSDRFAVSGQKLLSSALVFPQRIPRGQKEDHFDQHESGINPADLARGLDADSMAGPGDRGGQEHVRVELVVSVVDFDQQVEGIHFAGEL